jgi:cytochrome c-type biogenesis protein CcmE
MAELASPWQPPAEANGFRLRHTRLWVAAVVVAVAVAYLIVTALQNNAVYYLTVSELTSASPSVYAHESIRVAGNVVPDSIDRNIQSFTIRFRIADESGEMPVTYKGVLPDIFGPGIQVVVEGKRAEDGTFAANTLLAKCPSKFESS